jgi:uncharacterized membrane protein YdjX (TVP38/TMEM64 family)
MDKGRRQVLKGLVFLASLALIGFGLRAAGLTTHLDAAWMDSHIMGAGAWSWTLFLAFGALFTGVGLPRQLLSFLAGYAFGVAGGTLLAALATGAGCALAFYYARFMGREFVQARFGHRLRRLSDVLTASPLTTTMVIRFLPFGSNLATNLLAGVIPMPAGRFFLGSLVGYLPQTLVFALLGSGVRVDPVWRTVLSAALFGLSSLLGLWLYRHHRAARAVAGQDNGAI